MEKLRLECDGGTGSGCRLFLGDQEITNSTTACTINAKVGEPNTATIEVYLDKLDIDLPAEVTVVDKTPDDERTTFASKFREWIGV